MNTIPAAATRKHIAVFSAITLGIDLLVLAYIAAYILTMTGTFVDIFACMGERLPLLTTVVLSVGPVGWCAILGVAGAALIVKEPLMPWPGIRLGINAVAALVAVIFFEVYRYALMAPMYSMLESLQE